MTPVKFFAPTTIPTFRTINQMVDGLLNRNITDLWENPNNSFTTPSVNVVETPEYFRIDVAAPGVPKENFKIHIEKNILTISANQQTEKTDENKENNIKDIRYTRREFSYATFQRSFQLPENINTENISANYEQGILTLTLPKSAAKKLLKTIEIQ
jgi:HSP20 family protein